MRKRQRPQRYKDHEAYNRSQDYRAKFFAKHKGFTGWYCCSYCGKILTRKTATVDHIVPVNAAKYSRLLRWRLRHTEDGINSVKNLTVARRKCNTKKGCKKGKWIWRGRIGRYLYPILWVLGVAFAPHLLSYIIAVIQILGN